MTETLLFTYAAALGFVFAAMLATGYQWVANRPARFELVQDVPKVSIIGAIWRVSLVVWAAPYIIMRNALRAQLIEGRAVGWLLASIFIAGVWSVCVGVLVLHFAVVLG